MSILSTVPKGAAVEGINPNLLRNWYFVGGGTGRGVFPVNSRGATSYGSGVSNIDGYKTWRATVDLVSTGIKICSTAADQVGTNYQIVANPNELLGKTITISGLVDGVLLKNSATIPLSYSSTTIINASNIITLSMTASGEIRFELQVRITAGKVFSAVKLELGDQQTLAHQENGVWVLNEIPDYETEYYKCVTSDVDSGDTYANQKVSNITVQCNSVGSSSLRYYNNLIQSTHKVLDSTFSNPAAQTSDITVTTYDGYLDFSNGFASGATTNITLVLGTSGPVLSTSTTAPS